MNEDQEIWKDVVGYEGYYQVSNIGRVRSCDRIYVSHYTDGRGNVTVNRKGKIMRQQKNVEGYYRVQLSKNDVRDFIGVHRLVAMAFVSNPNPKKFNMVNHIDGNTGNNHVNNLEWIDNRGNQIHTIRTGLNKRVGTNSWWSKLTEEQVRFIRENYTPRGKYNFCTMAKMFNVSPRTIQNALVGITYYVVK